MQTIEQAAQQYADNICKYDSSNIFSKYARNECYTAFLAGAEWQSRQAQPKKQDERKTIKFSVNCKVYSYGMGCYREQVLISFSEEPTIEEIVAESERKLEHRNSAIESITRI